MGKFEQALAFGKVGEQAVSKWLQSRGHAVFPAYEKEGDDFKGPQLFSESGDLVLPDLLAFKSGNAIWFEAKRKTCFSWNRTRKIWVTGIDLRHYGEYQEVAERTGLSVWLLFYHPSDNPDKRDLAHGCPSQCPKGLFGNDIALLAKTENHRSDKWGKSGMVYWSVNDLRKIANAEDLA